MFRGVIGLLVGLSVALAASGRAEDEIRRAIDNLLWEWRAGERTQPKALTQAFFDLGQAASPELCKLLDDRPPDPLPVDSIAAAIGRLGRTDALPTLGRLSQSEHDGERLAAANALGDMDLLDGLPFLVRALDDPAVDVADRAEGLLLASRQQPKAIVMVLNENTRAVRDKVRIGRTLGQIDCKESRQALLRMLESFDEATILGGLQGVWHSGREEDGDVILRAMREHPTPGIQKQACLALGKLHVGSAIPDLIQVLRHPDRGVVANAHWALREITGLVLKAEPDLWQQWWDRGGSRKANRGGGP